MSDIVITDPVHTPQMQLLAHAIAFAEGFGLPGTVPTRANNPGDLKVPGWKGPVTGDEGISVLPTEADGWGVLYRQLQLIASEKSRVYDLDMTLEQMAAKWTDTARGPWGQNVCTYLQRRGLPASFGTTIRDVLDADWPPVEAAAPTGNDHEDDGA
jgi:hypothetical protein